MLRLPEKLPYRGFAIHVLTILSIPHSLQLGGVLLMILVDIGPRGGCFMVNGPRFAFCTAFNTFCYIAWESSLEQSSHDARVGTIR